MQQNLLLLGATGHLGKQIAKALRGSAYHITALVRSNEKGESIKDVVDGYVVADVLNPQTLIGICKGIAVVVSALGKPVSPESNDKPSFYEVDYKGNLHILEEAMKDGVKKFVYVSALGAEKNSDLEYFKAHHLFSQKLIASGIDYSIVQPPALFSAFIDLIHMAQKGRLMQLGKGDKATNPIGESDLAKVCVEAINKTNAVVTAGGEKIYTRKEITDIIQRLVDPGKKVRTVPAGVVKTFLPVLKLFNKNQYDKFAFFMRVLEEDTLADRIGKLSLEEYVKNYLAGNRSK